MCYENNFSHIDELVASTKEGDHNALWELFDYYKPVVFSTINQIHKKYPNIEKDDLYSESALILKDLCEKYDHDKSYFSYFFGARLHPYLIAKIKSKYVEKINIVSLSCVEEISRDTEINLSIDDNASLHAELDKLPAKSRYIVELFYFNNLTQSECAAILNISQPAFSKKLNRIISSLRKKIKL